MWPLPSWPVNKRTNPRGHVLISVLSNFSMPIVPLYFVMWQFKLYTSC